MNTQLYLVAASGTAAMDRSIAAVFRPRDYDPEIVAAHRAVLAR
jgi:hypothetical protein